MLDKLRLGHSSGKNAGSSLPPADHRFASIRQADSLLGDIGNDKVSFSGSSGKTKKHPLAALREKLGRHRHKPQQDDLF